MAAITVTKPTVAGTTLTTASASAGGDTVANLRGRTVLVVDNGGGSSINVTLTAQQTSRPKDGTFPAQTVADQVIAVAAGARKYIGPIPAAFVNASGNVAIAYSGVSSVTVGALELD